MPSIRDAYKKTELVIGLVGATGTSLTSVIQILKEALQSVGYSSEEVKVSEEIIPELIANVRNRPDFNNNEFLRLQELMNAGNKAREEHGLEILSYGVAAQIYNLRPKHEVLDKNNQPQEEPNYKNKSAYIINSLKHPNEVTTLRDIYAGGFYLIGVYSDEERRKKRLRDRGISEAQAQILMDRDKEEDKEYGQHNSDTFHLSDFFVHLDEDGDKLRNSIWRIINIMFGDPFKTPTFDEYAMFMAFSASLRTADLSRQVGAVIAKGDEILATGSNDCPKHGGGQYWPIFDKDKKEYIDIPGGRDYTPGRGGDSNKFEQIDIIKDIVEKIQKEYKDAKEEIELDSEILSSALNKSRIADITEYGRIVHAEMEALLSCARNNISTKGATLYCTTFPCHNCAKHIVGAGIERVVYVEPYPKSKAIILHSDSIIEGLGESDSKVKFEPFIGVGPRRFFDLFSLKLGSGYPIKRKNKETGENIQWKNSQARLRIQMMPVSYIDLEKGVGSEFEKRQSTLAEEGTQ